MFVTSTLDCFQERLEPTRLEALLLLHLKGMILALPENIRLARKRLTVTNTMAHYDSTIMKAHLHFGENYAKLGCFKNEKYMFSIPYNALA